MRFVRSVGPLLLPLALAAVFEGATRAGDDAPTEKLNKKVENVAFRDAAGKAFALADLKDKKAVAVVFLSFECPVSTAYSPVLAELARAYADKGVAFVGVAEGAEPAAAEKSARDYGLPFPVYADPRGSAADAFKAAVTPEAFVLDHNQVVRYRGRIDNGFAARLKKNQQTTQHDLREALDDLLAGKDVRTPATRAVGCPVRPDRDVKAQGAVTYYRDVLPVLQKNCQGCHTGPARSGRSR